MKIRNGFVSNSSSSSFVLDYHTDKKKDITSLKKVKEILNKLVEMEKLFNSKIKFEDIFNLNFDADNMGVEAKEIDIIKTRKEWEDNLYTEKTDFEKCKGKIIIHSAEDNSIPYWMKEFLEYKLNAKYWHWG